MKRTFLAALLALSVAGCGSETSQPAQPVSTAPVSAGTAAAPAVTATGGNLQAFIYPERLQSVSVAQAAVSGCPAGVRYAWSVNGLPVTDVTGDKLTPEHFRRDDEVSLQATCKGSTAIAVTRVTNSPPQVVKVGFRDPVVTAGKDLTAVPEAVDPDGDTAEFEFQWIIDGNEVPITAATLPGSYIKSGQQITINVTATDGIDRNTPYWGEPFIVAGAPPKFTSQPPQSFQVLEYRYQARAVDPDGDRITYRLEEAPPGMTIDPNSGLVVWPITRGTSGEFRVRIVAEDATGLFAGQEYTFGLQKTEAPQ